jgi:phosphatidylinositol alpha-mannosyltransferase
VAWYGIDYDKIAVIPNGVDLGIFTEHGDTILLQGDPSILFLGHMSRIKGLDTLFQAIAKLKLELPNMKLHIVGSGSVSYYTRMAEELDIKEFVIFHGTASHKMVPIFLRSANICVFPSRHEGFPLTLLEAMASGVPIVASNIEIFRKVLNEGERGLIFESGDANALSDSILILYKDLDLRRLKVRAALEEALNYSWANIAERYISLYRSLC